jgi:uncharacterized membrane protein
MTSHLLEDPIVKTLSLAFASLKLSLEQEVNICSTSSIGSIETICTFASKMNITEFHFWNKLIMVGSQKYEHMSL